MTYEIKVEEHNDLAMRDGKIVIFLNGLSGLKGMSIPSEVFKGDTSRLKKILTGIIKEIKRIEKEEKAFKGL